MRHSFSFGLILFASFGMPLAAQLPAVPKSTPLLTVPQRAYGAPVTASERLDLAIAIYRAATAHGTRMAHSAPLPRLVCLTQGRPWDQDPPDGVVEALQQSDALVVRPMSGCRKEPGPRRTPIYADRLTGQRGIAIWASAPRFTRGDGSFEVDLGYGEHELSAGLWKCTGRKLDGKWEVSTCTLTMGA